MFLPLKEDLISYAVNTGQHIFDRTHIDTPRISDERYLLGSGKIGIPNIGLSIIIFTIIIYMALLPLTIRQQKFSKLQQKMQPELAKIQAKYKNRKDQESMMRMNEETQALYKKYGVSPMGSCAQLLIQMPILFALYRVIYKIPAYVGQVKDAFSRLLPIWLQMPDPRSICRQLRQLHSLQMSSRQMIL